MLRELQGYCAWGNFRESVAQKEKENISHVITGKTNIQESCMKYKKSPWWWWIKAKILQGESLRSKKRKEKKSAAN